MNPNIIQCKATLKILRTKCLHGPETSLGFCLRLTGAWAHYTNLTRPKCNFIFPKHFHAKFKVTISARFESSYLTSGGAAGPSVIGKRSKGSSGGAWWHLWLRRPWHPREAETAREQDGETTVSLLFPLSELYGPTPTKSSRGATKVPVNRRWLVDLERLLSVG